MIYIIQKNRYKYGESMPPTPGTDKAGKCPAVAGGGLGTGGIDWYIRLLLNDCNKTTHHTQLHQTFTKEKKKLVEKERQQNKAKYASIK